MNCFRNAGLRAVGLVGLAALAGCGRDGPSGPTTGAIAITSTARTSSDNAIFAYVITVGDGTPQVVAASTPVSYVVPGLTAGAHTVTIRGLPAGCTAGADSRTVTVLAGDTVPVAVDVVCSRTTGDIAVTVATTGSEPDPDGFTITVDGVARGTIGPNGTTTLSGVGPGLHAVGLEGIASNCFTVVSRTAEVSVGTVAAVSSSVLCVAPTGPPRFGAIQFNITTTGDERDANGYAFFFDNSPNAARPATASGIVIFNGVPFGPHLVRVSDIASNCALTTPGLQQVLVNEMTPEVAVSVTCLASGSGTVGFTVADPADDTLPNSEGSLSPAIDLLSTTGRYSPGWLTLTLRFSAPVVPIARLAPNSLHGYLQLDLDENAATGQPPAINGLGGNATHGVDVTIALDADSTSAYVVRAGTPLGRAGIRFLGDSVVLSAPRALLSNDDGNFTFSGAFGTDDRPTDLVPGTGVLTARRPVTAVAGLRQGWHASPPMTWETLDFPPARIDLPARPPAGGWTSVGRPVR